MKLTWLKKKEEEKKGCHWGEKKRRTSLTVSLSRLKERKMKERKEESLEHPMCITGPQR